MLFLSRVDICEVGYLQRVLSRTLHEVDVQAIFSCERRALGGEMPPTGASPDCRRHPFMEVLTSGQARCP
ncbi:hypothetical protein CK203_024957 [Vitis vinifera]|uniref:Uncharacterized protein n=1 Tax=Vitis vinifera TaxID=29760 RepID=A0A438J779_VITVI|nr:hypothetical protein CK203_024957 [Vitis vinifera]